MSKIHFKSESDIAELRISGKILSDVLHATTKQAAVGVSLQDLNKKAEDMIKDAGASPAFLGYTPAGAREPYPASICASVNDVVVHGVPNEYELQDGDLLTIDAGVDYNGFITDSAVTIGIGNISKEKQALISCTREALQSAVSACVEGNAIGDIGYSVEQVVNQTSFKIIRNLTGHGVGFDLHEEPTIFNYGKKGSGPEIQPGMVLALEPMISVSSEYVIQNNDGGYATDDGSDSAHFETTVAVTESGTDVLVDLPGVSFK